MALKELSHMRRQSQAAASAVGICAPPKAEAANLDRSPSRFRGKNSKFGAELKKEFDFTPKCAILGNGGTREGSSADCLGVNGTFPSILLNSMSIRRPVIHV
jgi:hypothetical protein